jgi:hypothetical protein
VLVAHTYDPSYLGGWDQEDDGSRPTQTNWRWRPHLQNNHNKMDWKCGSSQIEPTLQVWSLEANSSPMGEKKKKLFSSPQQGFVTNSIFFF